MKYLLDTCVISEFIKLQPNANVIRWLEGCDEDSTFLSVLTIGELQKGIEKLDEGRRKRQIQHWLNSDVRKRFSERIIRIDEEIAIRWGHVHAEAELRGKPIPVIDGLLGATALSHDLIVVTRNESDLLASGARVVNPWKN